MLHNGGDNAIISVCAGVRARQSLPASILGQAQCQTVFFTQLLKFRDGALGNDRDSLGE